MPLQIDVIDIKNSMHQLSALPIEESVFVLFSSKPDAEQIKKYIHLLRIDSESTWPSVGDPNYTQILYSKEKFGDVEYTYNIIQDSPNFILEINPVKPLYTNSNYVLYIEKGISAQYYSINKTVSRSNSELKVLTHNSAPISEISEYIILIKQSSQLSNGNHTVVFDVIKNGNTTHSDVSLNILLDNTFILNDATSVSFNPNIPYIATESFNIVLDSSLRLVSNRIQNISTHVDAEVIKTEDNESGRLQYQDIINFYKDNVFIQNQPTQPNQISKSTVKYISINKFIVTFDKSLSNITITPLSFNLSFSEAFGNYMLANMGRYKKDNKYLVYYKVLDNFNIQFRVELDSENVVPSNLKYTIIQDS